MSVVVITSLLLIVVFLGCVGVGIYVIAKSRQRDGTSGPRCGHCGYNLTGAVSNRCPECGKLFIEAGVITEQHPASRPRHTIRVVMLVGLAMCGVVGTIWGAMRGRAVRARAVAARRAAVQAQAQAQTAATQAALEEATTTAPANSAERP